MQLGSRRIFLILIILFFNTSLVFAEASSTPSLKVGLILPLSGELSALGNGIRNGAMLAQEELGKRNIEVELIFEDNKGELAASATAANQLVNIRKIDAFVSIISGVAQVLKPIAIKNQILNIGICSDSDVGDGDYNFVNYLTAEQGVEKYLQYYRSDIGTNKTLGVYLMSESGFEKITNVLKRISNDNPRIGFIENFNRGEKDFRPSLLRNKKYNVENILILGLSPEIEILAKQIKTLGLSVPLTSIESFGLANDKKLFENSWFVDSASPNKNLSTRYKDRFNADPTPGVGQAYDSIMMLSYALEKSRSTLDRSRASMKTEFREIKNFTGSTGNLNVRSDGVIWGSASIKRIINGRVVEAELSKGDN